MSVNNIRNTNTWQFDIVRGIMCLFIFNCHFFAMFNFPVLPSVGKYLKSFISNAPLGIIYFFMLSGMVLSLSFFRKKTELKSIPRFVVKRFLRLLPPILISLAVTYVIMRSGLIFIDNLKPCCSLSNWAASLFQFNPNDVSPLEDIINAYFLGHSEYNANLWIVRFEFLVPLAILAMHKFVKYKAVQTFALLSFTILMGG